MATGAYRTPDRLISYEAIDSAYWPMGRIDEWMIRHLAASWLGDTVDG